MAQDLNDFIQEEFGDDDHVLIDIELHEAFIDIAQSIYEFRAKRKISQHELADKVGSSQPSIARWETPGYTRYTIKSLVKLAHALRAKLIVKLEEPTTTIFERLQIRSDIQPTGERGPQLFTIQLHTFDSSSDVSNRNITLIGG